MRPARIHNLRGNARESSPHRLLIVDTESWWATEARTELHQLRLWAARLIIRDDGGGAEPAGRDYDGHTADELADLVTDQLQAGTTTWLFTHNLSYDLGLTRLPLHLIERGFKLGAHNLASDAPWARLSRGALRLVLADSFSWLPVSVERLGELLELPKARLPLQDDPEAAWLRRCQLDVHITATAVCRALDTWDALRLGHWSLTGPASGWNSLRHAVAQRQEPRRRGIVHRQPESNSPTRHAGVVIDPDPAARAFERLALYSGRRDLWRVGRLVRGPYAELDLKTAHLAVCAHFPLPLRRQREFDSLPLDDWRLSNQFESLIAECVVSSPEPRYPFRHKGAVLHPVGSFQTVLCGPEIKDALARGELVSIGHGYSYHVGYFMQPWSRWALSVLNPEPEQADSILQTMVKGWSRTVPGRWGMLHSTQLAAGPSHVQGWALEPAAIGTPPRRGFIFHFAGQWTRNLRDQEADDSFPAVLAHIQSWTRLLLNRALARIPEGCLVSCNTEGFWVHQAALEGLARLSSLADTDTGYEPDHATAALALLNTQTAPLELRIKQTAKSLRLLSPQHLEIDGTLHYAGVPKTAAEPERDVFEFWTWPKLKGQIERGDPRGYVREQRRVNLSGLPVSRWAYADGCCEPVGAAWSPLEGVTSVRPPYPLCSGHSARLNPLQHPALRGSL